jgi:glycosyltransferase involved in cell wall biosynthesis
LSRAPVIPAGVDLTFFKPAPQAEARERLGWDRARRYVLFPGARSNSVKNVRLFDSVVEDLRRERPEITPVCLEGFDRREVVDVMNAVDVVLMTSLSEGSPVTVKEALACGTPVVSVDVGDVAEVISGAQGCSCHSHDAVALADGVRAALRPVDKLTIRRRASAYDRAIVARRVAEIYTDVLARSSS